MFRLTEKRRFDSLEVDHLARLEGERRGRNDSRMRFLGRFLDQLGMTTHAGELLAIRNLCGAHGSDAGGDPRIHQLIDDIKRRINDPDLRSRIPEPFINTSDLISRQNWNRFRSCWDSWENIVSILDYRLIAINITGRPDRAIVDFKGDLDGLRDRVVAALRPFANWYSWHLDVSLDLDNRHPHYHCLFIVPAKADRAVFDAVNGLKEEAFRNDEGLHVKYRDWLKYDRRRPMLDMAERQRSWIAALAYVTRIISHRPVPLGKAVPTLSSFLDVDNHVDQVRQQWDAAFHEVLKRNDFDKALGARRMALFLRQESRRRVVSFRQSKRWKSIEAIVGPDEQRLAPRPSLDLAGDAEGDIGPWLDTLEAHTLLHKTAAPVVSDNDSERCSESTPEELEQKDLRPAAASVPDDDSNSSMVIHKGFKENPVGRPRRQIGLEELGLALIDGGTCTAAAAILRTSTRRVREEMKKAGIDSLPRGRPKGERMRG